MKAPSLPENEIERVESIRKYNILDTTPEASYDRIVSLARDMLDVPMAAISFVDSSRQWFKSKIGIDAQSTSREVSFCGHAILSHEVMVVEDTLKDERFFDSPVCIAEPRMRFYVGAPIIDRKGLCLGTVCVIDRAPRSRPTPAQIRLLETLAQQVVELLELRKANYALTQVVKQSRDIQKMSHTGGWELDPKNGNVTWTEEVYEIHKIPLGTPTHKIEAINFYAEHERPRITKCVEECIQYYKSFDEEFEIIDAEGAHKWVRAIGEPVLGIRGELIKIAGTFQDVTDLKRREVALHRMTKNLKELNSRLEIALESMHMGVWDLSLEHDTLLWDEGMFRIFKHPTNNTMSGKDIWARCLHPEDRDRVYRDLEKFLSTDASYFKNECRIIRGDGEIRYLKIVARIIRFTDRAPRIVGVNWDFTEEHRMNEDLLQQRKITQHNAKLAAIGELAAGVAHEINNPLTIIYGFVNLLEKHIREEDWSRDQLLEVLGKVNRSTERISNIVRGLRNFSRLDTDAIAPFNLVECCLEATSLLAGIYNKEGIQLTFHNTNEKEIWVEGNSGKLQQVLINLISNAKDATEGQETRTIQVTLSCEENGAAVIRVEDNGPGVPAEIREKIFEPFFTTKEVNKGTGIGLSLVHTIVQEHHGHILLEEKTEGASFRVELPVLPKAA